MRIEQAVRRKEKALRQKAKQQHRVVTEEQLEKALEEHRIKVSLPNRTKVCELEHHSACSAGQ